VHTGVDQMNPQEEWDHIKKLERLIKEEHVVFEDDDMKEAV